MKKILYLWRRENALVVLKKTLPAVERGGGRWRNTSPFTTTLFPS
jgi:hypothetical protein